LKHKLLTIGDNCFDITIKGKFKFESDKNFIPENYKALPAGTGVNFAAAFGVFFGESYYFTPISKDSFGNEIKQFLIANNVKLLGKETDKNTALIIAIVNNTGERSTFALLKNASYEDISFKEFEKIKEGFDAIYISCGICTTQKVQREILKIAEEAKLNRIKVFFDPQIRIGKDIPGFLNSAIQLSEISDIIFANSEELKAMDIPQEGFIVDKKGEKGAVVFYNSKRISVKGIKVNVADTTGAGDIFNAAFLSEILSDKTIAESLKFANYAAALSITKKGVYIPKRSDVEKFIEKTK